MSSQTSPFTTRAYAKLNLALAVGPGINAPGTPHHGYHPICSYMHAIELFDTIEIERSWDEPETRFDIAWSTIDGSSRPVDWPIERDLVCRAHRALCDWVGRKLPCSIRVRKSIPAGGGLGGGSSDGACVLTGLDQVFGLALGADGLRGIAMTLGSDIAYFIDEGTIPRPAIVSGFGERIERVNASHAGAEVTLILPPFGCSTREVYQAFDTQAHEAIEPSRVRRAIDATELDDGLLLNDLAPAARAVEPRLGEIIDRLSGSLDRRVHMTGSGSTLFVLGRVDEARIHEVAPDCRVVSTRLV